MAQKRGRKSSKEYIISNLDKIKKLASEGYSEKEIIKALGIASSTYYKYKSLITEFKECIPTARQTAIEELENITYKTAMGYEYEEEKMIIQLDEDGNPAQQQYILNNWTKGKYTKDPLVAKFREEELKLKQEANKYEEW